MTRDTKWIALLGVVAIVVVGLSLGLLAKPMPRPSPSPASATPASLSPAAVTSVSPFLQATSTPPKPVSAGRNDNSRRVWSTPIKDHANFLTRIS